MRPAALRKPDDAPIPGCGRYPRQDEAHAVGRRADGRGDTGPLIAFHDPGQPASRAVRESLGDEPVEQRRVHGQAHAVEQIIGRKAVQAAERHHLDPRRKRLDQHGASKTGITVDDGIGRHLKQRPARHSRKDGRMPTKPA